MIGTYFWRPRRTHSAQSFQVIWVPSFGSELSIHMVFREIWVSEHFERKLPHWPPNHPTTFTTLPEIMIGTMLEAPDFLYSAILGSHMIPSFGSEHLYPYSEFGVIKSWRACWRSWRFDHRTTQLPLPLSWNIWDRANSRRPYRIDFFVLRSQIILAQLLSQKSLCPYTKLI